MSAEVSTNEVQKQLVVVFDLDETLIRGNTYNYLALARGNEVQEEVRKATLAVKNTESLPFERIVAEFGRRVVERIELLRLNESDFTALEEKYREHLSEGALSLVDFLRNELKASVFIVSFALKPAVDVAGRVFGLPSSSTFGIEYTQSEQGIELSNDRNTQSLLHLNKAAVIAEALLSSGIIDQANAKIVKLVLVGDSRLDLDGNGVASAVCAINSSVGIEVIRVGVVLEGDAYKETKLQPFVDAVLNDMADLRNLFECIKKSHLC